MKNYYSISIVKKLDIPCPIAALLKIANPNGID